MPAVINIRKDYPDYEKIFWNKVDRTDSDGCWKYLGPIRTDGYGVFHLANYRIKAHRYAWELTRKCKVPEGKGILHLCDNRACCNPMHLYCGSAADNARDRSKNDTNRCLKISIAKAKFYSGEIWLIRRLEGKASSRFVGKMFKCNHRTIARIWSAPIHPCKEGVFV